MWHDPTTFWEHYALTNRGEYSIGMLQSLQDQEPQSRWMTRRLMGTAGRKPGILQTPSRLGNFHAWFLDSPPLLPAQWPLRPGNLDMLNVVDLMWSDFGPQHRLLQPRK